MPDSNEYITERIVNRHGLFAVDYLPSEWSTNRTLLNAATRFASRATARSCPA